MHIIWYGPSEFESNVQGRRIVSRPIAIQSPYKIKWPTAPRSSVHGVVSEYRIIHMIIIGIMRPLTCASYLIHEASELSSMDAATC